MPYKPIKHAQNPMGDSQVAAVGEFLGHLTKVIKDCPPVPDQGGRDSISVENILKLIDTLYEKYAHSLSSFYYDIRTGERVEGYTEKEFKEQKEIGFY